MAAPTPRRHPFRPYLSAIFILLLAVSLPGFVRAQAPPPSVTITDLGSWGAKDINSQGQIVGAIDGHAVMWQNGTFTNLGTLGGERSAAFAINEQGQVVGWSEDADGYTRAFRWEKGTMIGLVSSDGYYLAHAIAEDINNRGQIVGSDLTFFEHWHPFLWENGTMITIGGGGEEDIGEAFAINDQGQIVGISGGHAFLWQNGVMTDLSAPIGGFSWAYAVNDQGQVAGMAITATGEQNAVLWQNGSMTDLGTLGGRFSIAWDINDKGQVVGGSDTITGETRAFLWQNGSMTDLGTLGGNSARATAINDEGQIIGWSETATGETHAVLWEILPTSSSPRQQIQAIKSEVNKLITQSALNKGQGNALTTKLNGALAKLDRGNKKAAANHLHAFVNQVNAFHKSRKLSTAQARPLMDAANRIIAKLRQ